MTTWVDSEQVLQCRMALQEYEHARSLGLVSVAADHLAKAAKALRRAQSALAGELLGEEPATGVEDE